MFELVCVLVFWSAREDWLWMLVIAVLIDRLEVAGNAMEDVIGIRHADVLRTFYHGGISEKL